MEINIRPEVNILGVLRHLNYKPWYALAEFVDNSVVSALRGGTASPGNPLQVVIDFWPDNGGRIVIRDNAAGIGPDDFPRAFRAAQLPPDRSGLSEFGMGMKSAASWFAKHWTVRTSVAGEPVERVVRFNLDEIEQSMREYVDVEEGPAPANAHFTTVELTNLNHIPQTKTISKIREHLSSIYREFIRAEFLELTFRGEVLAFDEVEPLVAPVAGRPDTEPITWLKPIDFALDEVHHVRGFAGLRAVGSTAKAGFALLRRGRIIVGSGDDTYRPTEIFGKSTTYTYQRLYGELTLDGFEVSHTKDGFRWDELEDLFLERLEEELASNGLDLLTQASNYRAKPTLDLRRPIETAVTRVSASVQDHFDAVADRLLAEYKDELPLPDEVEERSLSPISRKVRVVLDSEIWVVKLEATLDDGVSDWIEVGAASTASGGPGVLPQTHVKVTVSLAHPFSRKFLGATNENAELIIAFASTLGLALALGKRSGAKSQSIVNRINQLARETFSVVSGVEDKQ